MIDRHEAIYPGHPITLAAFVVQAFPGGLSAALAPTKDGWPTALGCHDVPGAGGCVYAALDFLGYIQTVGFEQAIGFANRHWQVSTDCLYRDYRGLGQEQAEALLPELREMLAAWDHNGGRQRQGP